MSSNLQRGFMMKQKNWFSFFAAFFFLFSSPIFSHGIVNAEQGAAVKAELNSGVKEEHNSAVKAEHNSGAKEEHNSGAKEEQGEEIYAPPKPKEEHQKPVEEKKIKLKEFIKKGPKKSSQEAKDIEKMKESPDTVKTEGKKETQEEPPTKEVTKDSHGKVDGKAEAEEDQGKEDTKGEAKEDHSKRDGKESPKAEEKNDKIEVEKPMQAEGNKLVEPDDKNLEDKKSNGIFWFFGVFIALLIVIFAFT